MSTAQRCAFTTLLLLSWILASSGTTRAVDVQELAPITESFCQLAMWDAQAAGEIWMGEQALQTWERFVEIALPDPTAMLSLFSHTVLLGIMTESNVPIAGIIDPWTGTFITLVFSENAASIEAVTIERVTAQSVSGMQTEQAARSLMEAITAAGDRLDYALAQSEDSGSDESDWQRIADALLARTAQLRYAYPAGEPRDPAIRVAQETVLAILGGQLSGLTQVLEDADKQWLQSLAPVYALKVDDEMVLALGSSLEPLDLIWLHIRGSRLHEVSWIRLFDRMITQVEEAS